MAGPFPTVCFVVWFRHIRVDWLLDLPKRPRRTLAHSPRAVPWENTLPWASVMISQTAVAADREREFVCAKDVDKSTSRSVGISVIVRTPNACVWCGAGRQRGGKPSGVSSKRLKPSMPRQNVPAVNAAHLCPKLRRLQRLLQRVVTQQKFYRRRRCALGQAVMNRL
jgi:hypothetical protein